MNARKPPMITKSSSIMFKSNKELNRAVAREMERLEPEYFQKHAAELIPQYMAMVLWTIQLNKGEEAMREFIEDFHETDYLMDNPSKLHHRFDPTDCDKELKEKYGIDVRKEFPIRTEVQK